MSNYKSLQHTKWECKYHVVFIPKYRKKLIYGELRRHLGQELRRLAGQKESLIEEGHLLPDHLAIESFTSALQTREEKDRSSTELLLKAELLMTFSNSGREAEATELFEELRDTIPSSDEERSKYCLAYHFYHLGVTGHWDRVCSYSLELVKAAGMNRLSPRLIGRLSNVWIARCYVGDLLCAKKIARYCDQEARLFRHPDLAIVQASNLATLRRKQGETSQSLESVEGVGPIIESTCAIPLWLEHFAMLKAKNLVYLLLLDEALTQLGVETSQSAWWKKKKDSARAWSWILLGCPSRALSLVPVSGDPRHLLIRSQWQMARAQAYLQLGQLARARKEAEEALVTLPDT